MDVFVGRTDEIRHLARRLRKEPVTVLLGRGGIGKTATALRALAQHSPVFDVDVRPGDDLRQTLLSLARATARGPRASVVNDASTLLRDAIVACDDTGGVVFVDDLHHLRAEDARSLVVAARAARRCRFLFAARTLDPIPEVLEHVVTLGDLDPRSLVTLARRVVPTLSAAEAKALARVAHGSPWLLRHTLWAQREAPPSAAEILEALPRTTASVVRLLGALELPIAAGTLRSLADTPMEALERAGIEFRERGVRAHDVLRDLLGAEPEASVSSGALRAGLAEAALEQSDPRGIVEAVRLQIAGGLPEAAAATLRTGFDVVVDGGLAPRLYTLLAKTTSVSLAPFRLRAALALGAGPEVDEVVAAPRATTPEARVAWAELLLLVGRYFEAEEGLAAVREVAQGDLRDEATLLLVRTRLLLGDTARAAALLDERDVEGPSHVARARALRARLLLARGDAEGASTHADELGALVDRLPPPTRREVQHARLFVYSATGRMREVRALADQLYGVPARGTSMLEGIGATCALALLEIESARFVEARRLLAQLEVPATHVTSLRFFHDLGLARLLMLEGDFAAASDRVERVRVAAETVGDSNASAWAAVAAALAAAYQGDATEREAPHEGGPQRPFLVAFERMRRARRGLDDLPSTPAPSAPDARVVTGTADALVALVADRPAVAVEHARRAVEVADRHGYHAHAVEARLWLVDVLLAGGRAAAALAVLAEVDAALLTIPSPRLLLEASLARALATDAPWDLELLERAAGSANVSPRAARRAAALLGIPQPRDEVERRVLGGRVWRGSIETVLGAADARRPGWIVDRPGGRVHKPEGVVALKPDSQAAQILFTLLERRQVSKEQLASAVWGVVDYHPLRDDKRMHVAVLRLRQLVERDPGRPTRVVTTGDGYALGDSEPVRIVRGPPGHEVRRGA